MGVNYNATYGIGVSLKSDELIPEDFYREIIPEGEQVHNPYEYYGEPDTLGEAFKPLLKDYEFLYFDCGGDNHQGWYDYYILIRDPLENLDMLPFKMEQLRKFIKENNFEKYCWSTEPDLVGGCYIW